MSTDARLKFAVFGLGRMGARHARNVAFLTPRAELVAVVDPSEEARNAAAEWLPRSVKLYASVQDCLAQSGCEAVLIASATAAHAEDAIASIEAGKVGHGLVLGVGIGGRSLSHMGLQTKKRWLRVSGTVKHKIMTPGGR